jgi:hypothetical protein
VAQWSAPRRARSHDARGCRCAPSLTRRGAAATPSASDPNTSPRVPAHACDAIRHVTCPPTPPFLHSRQSADHRCASHGWWCTDSGWPVALRRQLHERVRDALHVLRLCDRRAPPRDFTSLRCTAHTHSAHDSSTTAHTVHTCPRHGVLSAHWLVLHAMCWLQVLFVLEVRRDLDALLSRLDHLTPALQQRVNVWSGMHTEPCTAVDLLVPLFHWSWRHRPPCLALSGHGVIVLRALPSLLARPSPPCAQRAFTSG